ncbi:MAG: nuclear transport factor 2 family protein [Burkholderiales bacterium]
MREAELITAFYAAFARRDAAAMRACYHPEVVFSDPVFGELSGEHAGEMWAMLCSRAKDLAISCSGVSADAGEGSARWEATYTFTHTGRRVHNVIDARFRFRDGLIVRHDDHFDLYRWSRMAFGPAGVLLGWTPFFQAKIRANAKRGFGSWLAKRR